ncbi:hypothetical protein Ahy_B01g055638 [Arachis hypogaea]|uniref:Uncharacterized protein n=1 Tax=Arachis hypogaea TaxID=3818 RepID=A0A445AWU7_ARAHY|nr:hypothetical protein Ahy_B01g055638 [Arachis hypogaea]
MIRFKNARSRCYVSLSESEVVKITIMGLGFYIRQKLLNVHISDLAHLAEKVRQVELLKKEKEKYENEKSCFVAMEFLEEEFDLEAEVDLAKLKKGPPYICSLLKKLLGNEKLNDSKLKSGKRYIRSVYPRVGDGLLDFLVQQKLKDHDVSLCPRCNTVFDVEVAAIFEKERMKKELAHREEQARQKQPIRRAEGPPQHNMIAPISRSQAIGVQWIRNCQEFHNRDTQYRRNPQWGHRRPPRGQYPYYRGRATRYLRGRGRRNQQQTNKSQNNRGKRETPSVHSRIVFPSDGETCPKGIPSPTKLDKGKAVVSTSGVDKDKDVDLEEEYFEEVDDEMVLTISIIPTEYLGEYEGDLEDDYDIDNEKVFSFIRYEDEPGYFLRPSEKQKFHLCPLHITTTMSGIKINKVLIDDGVVISLLPERMLIKVGKYPDDLVPTNIAVTDFSEGFTVKLRHPHLIVPQLVGTVRLRKDLRHCSMEHAQEVSDYLTKKEKVLGSFLSQNTVEFSHRPRPKFKRETGCCSTFRCWCRNGYLVLLNKMNQIREQWFLALEKRQEQEKLIEQQSRSKISSIRLLSLGQLHHHHPSPEGQQEDFGLRVHYLQKSFRSTIVSVTEKRIKVRTSSNKGDFEKLN